MFWLLDFNLLVMGRHPGVAEEVKRRRTVLQARVEELASALVQVPKEGAPVRNPDRGRPFAFLSTGSERQTITDSWLLPIHFC